MKIFKLILASFAMVIAVWHALLALYGPVLLQGIVWDRVRIAEGITTLLLVILAWYLLVPKER